MYQVSLATIREEVRQRCDLPDTFATNAYISQALVDGWINRAARRLAERIIALDEDYTTTVATLVTQAGVGLVSLPSDCFKLVRLVWARGTNDLVPLRRALHDEWLGMGDVNLAWTGGAAYGIVGSTVQFWPTPDGAYSLRAHYVQLPTDLVADGDSLNLGPGWEEWIIADVCGRVASKEERLDAKRGFDEERAQAEAYIREAAADRDVGEPHFIRRASAYRGSTRQRWDRSTLGDS